MIAVSIGSQIVMCFRPNILNIPIVKPNKLEAVQTESQIYMLGHLHEDLRKHLSPEFAMLFTQIAFQEAGDGLRGEVAANAKNPFGVKSTWARENASIYVSKYKTEFAQYNTYEDAVHEIKCLIIRNPLNENETVYEWLKRMHWNDFTPNYYNNVEKTTFVPR